MATFYSTSVRERMAQSLLFKWNACRRSEYGYRRMARRSTAPVPGAGAPGEPSQGYNYEYRRMARRSTARVPGTGPQENPSKAYTYDSRRRTTQFTPRFSVDPRPRALH